MISFDWLLIYITLWCCLLHSKILSKQVAYFHPAKSSFYGDLGDEISTNYNSNLNVPMTEKKRFDVSEEHLVVDSNHSSHILTKIQNISDNVHYINPIIYSDFIALPRKQTEKQNMQSKRSFIDSHKKNLKYVPMNPQEIMALNYLKKSLDPSNVHVRSRTKKRSSAEIQRSREKLINIARSFRSPSYRHMTLHKPHTYILRHANTRFNRENIPWFNSNQKIIENNKFTTSPSKANLYMQKEILHNMIRPRYNNVVKEHITAPTFSKGISRYRDYNNETSNSVTPAWHNKWSTRRTSPTKDQFSERGRSLKNVASDILQKSEKYRNSSLLSELAKVTMKTIRFKEPVRRKKNKSLINDLSKVTMRWTGFKDSATVKASSVPDWLKTLKKVMQPKSPFFKRKKLIELKDPATFSNRVHPRKNVQIAVSPQISSTTPNRLGAHKKQLTVQEHISISINPPMQSTYIAQPGVIPWNYFHAEYLPDGRIRPALYPIAKHIQQGKCLPETSLCDKGLHEQCCGSLTFCVDYWGISKCLAFGRINSADYHDPYQIVNNLNYKNYYRDLLLNKKIL